MLWELLTSSILYLLGSWIPNLEKRQLSEEVISCQVCVFCICLFHKPFWLVLLMTKSWLLCNMIYCLVSETHYKQTNLDIFHHRGSQTLVFLRMTVNSFTRRKYIFSWRAFNCMYMYKCLEFIHAIFRLIILITSREWSYISWYRIVESQNQVGWKRT